MLTVTGFLYQALENLFGWERNKMKYKVVYSGDFIENNFGINHFKSFLKNFSFVKSTSVLLSYIEPIQWQNSIKI